MNESNYSTSSIFAQNGPVDPDLFISDDLTDLDLVDSPPTPYRKRWTPKLLGASFFRKVFKKKNRLAAQLLIRNKQDNHFPDDDEEDFLTDRGGNSRPCIDYDDKEPLDSRSTSPTQLSHPESIYKERRVRFSEYAVSQLYYPEREISEIKRVNGVNNIPENKPSKKESNRKTRHKPRKRRKQKHPPNCRYQDLYDEEGEHSWGTMSEAESDDIQASIDSQSRSLFAIKTNDQLDERCFEKRRDAKSAQQRRQRRKEGRKSLSSEVDKERNNRNELEAATCIQKFARTTLQRLRHQSAVRTAERHFANFDEFIPAQCDPRIEAARQIQKVARVFLICVKGKAKERLQSGEKLLWGDYDTSEEQVLHVPQISQRKGHDSYNNTGKGDIRIEAACTIQKLYRTYVRVSRTPQTNTSESTKRTESAFWERSEVLKDTETRAAVILQKSARYYLVRIMFRRMKLASVKIQRRFQRHLDRFNKERLKLLESRLTVSETMREREIRSIRSQLSKRKELHKLQTEMTAIMNARLVDDHEMQTNLYLEEYKNLCTENSVWNQNVSKLRDENKSMEKSIVDMEEVSIQVELRINEAAEFQETLRTSMLKYEQGIVKLQNAIDIRQKYCLIENKLRKSITAKTGSMLEIIRQTTSSKTNDPQLHQSPCKTSDIHVKYSVMRHAIESSEIALMNIDSILRSLSGGSIERVVEGDRPDRPLIDEN